MLARLVDVAHVVAIARIADRAEALVHDDFGEAENGVERRADLVADLGEEVRLQRAGAFGLATGVAEFALDLLPGREIAQDGAEFRRRAAKAAERHEDGDRTALMGARHELATVVEYALHAARLHAVEIGGGGLLAFLRDEDGERLAGDLVLVETEQGLARAIERENAALAIEHGDAVGRRVEDGVQFARLGVALAQVELQRFRASDFRTVLNRSF